MKGRLIDLGGSRDEIEDDSEVFSLTTYKFGALSPEVILFREESRSVALCLSSLRSPVGIHVMPRRQLGKPMEFGAGNTMMLRVIRTRTRQGDKKSHPEVGGR